MIKSNLFFLVLILLFSACNNQEYDERIALLENRLEENDSLLNLAQKTLVDQQVKSEDLMHLVFFQVKEEAGEEGVTKVLELLKSLSQVASAKQVFGGIRTETNDARAAKDYQVALLVQFNKQSDLAIYQQDAFHLEVREKVGPLLAGPPKVYDFTLK